MNEIKILLLGKRNLNGVIKQFVVEWRGFS